MGPQVYYWRRRCPWGIRLFSQGGTGQLAISRSCPGENRAHGGPRGLLQGSRGREAPEGDGHHRALCPARWGPQETEDTGAQVVVSPL